MTHALTFQGVAIQDMGGMVIDAGTHVPPKLLMPWRSFRAGMKPDQILVGEEYWIHLLDPRHISTRECAFELASLLRTASSARMRRKVKKRIRDLVRGRALRDVRASDRARMTAELTRRLCGYAKR